MHKDSPPICIIQFAFCNETASYQIPVFNDNTTGILGLHWARQHGKSTVLAAWAVDRLLTHPGRLVTVLTA